MIVELQVFAGYREGAEGFGRDAMEFHALTFNTEYVAWLRRRTMGSPPQEFCQVHFSDHGSCFTVAQSYEDMRKLVRSAHR